MHSFPTQRHRTGTMEVQATCRYGCCPWHPFVWLLFLLIRKSSEATSLAGSVYPVDVSDVDQNVGLAWLIFLQAPGFSFLPLEKTLSPSVYLFGFIGGPGQFYLHPGPGKQLLKPPEEPWRTCHCLALGLLHRPWSNEGVVALAGVLSILPSHRNFLPSLTAHVHNALRHFLKLRQEFQEFVRNFSYQMQNLLFSLISNVVIHFLKTIP